MAVDCFIRFAVCSPNLYETSEYVPLIGSLDVSLFRKRRARSLGWQLCQCQALPMKEINQLIRFYIIIINIIIVTIYTE